MSRALNRLSHLFVKNAKEPGWHADGGGLYLRITPAGGRKWVFVFHSHGSRKEMGLGGAGTVGLADARLLAVKARKAVAEGLDPAAVRRAIKAAGAPPTFGVVAEEVIASLEPGWRNKKTAAQWTASLTQHAPNVWKLPVDQVTTDDVLKALSKIWNSHPETASRVRGRIERILDAAEARGLRSGKNPAQWRGHLAVLLPKRRKLARGHHAAMPFPDVPAFLVDLKARPALAARALELTILTVSRTSEVLGATPHEFDLDAGIWTRPARRMKAGLEHRVALTARGVEIVRALAEGLGPDDYLFPGQRRKKGDNNPRPLSNMSMDMLLRRMGHDDVTVHGFRSSFRDWAGETTNFPRELVELALAHKVGDETERAYRRGDALERRRKLMEAWAGFCARPVGGNVRSFGDRRRRTQEG